MNKYYITYFYVKENKASCSSLFTSINHYIRTKEDVCELKKFIIEKENADIVIILNWHLLEDYECDKKRKRINNKLDNK